MDLFYMISKGIDQGFLTHDHTLHALKVTLLGGNLEVAVDDAVRSQG